jgi:adenylate kinase family enzyme
LKNIIIAGPGRAGKTTLARRIGEELNYFVFSLDRLIAIFDGAFPQLDIRLAWDREKTTGNITPFIGHFLGSFSSRHGVMHELILRAHAVEGNKFVLEGGHFDFDEILPVLKMYGIHRLKQRFILIGLTQNQKSADEIYNDLKKYDTEDDWTYHCDDDELRAISEDAVTSGRYMTDHLLKHGFTIYDTSFERERVFERIIEDIRTTPVQAEGRRAGIPSRPRA